MIISVVFLTFIFMVWFLTQNKSQTSMNTQNKSQNEITYVPIGDSYTIGNGVSAENRWPNVLVGHLKDEGIDMELMENPAVSGFTVRDAIRIELPVVEKVKPDFVTVLIGANDSFAQRDVKAFHGDLIQLLDKLQSILPSPKNIVLITIPDYSKSPAASSFDTQGVSELIKDYNVAINEEAKKRGLKIADIFPVSQTMTGREDYIDDGLHPSAAGYTKWEKIIFPVVRDVLKY